MPRIAWSAVLFGVGLFALLGGSRPAGHASPPLTPDQWIEKLGSPDFPTRETAEKAIRTLGPSALPSLRQAKVHADPEVRRRVEGLIDTLERELALAPKRVTLNVTDRPVTEAVASLARQTGYKIDLQQDKQEKPYCSFHLDNVPFWEALDKVCEAGQLTYQLNGNNDGTIQLYFQDSYVPFICRNGPFRMVAGGFQYSRGIEFSQLPKGATDAGQRSESLNFSFVLGTEPKLPLLWVGTATLAAAYDDQNCSMLPDPQVSTEVPPRYGNGYKTYQAGANINLVMPSARSRSVKVIKGALPVTILAEEKPEIVVDKVQAAKGKKFQGGGASLNIEDVAEENDGSKVYKVKLTVAETHGQEGVANDSSWANSLNQRFALLDDKGNRFVLQGVNWENVSATSAQGTVLFTDQGGTLKIGPPARLIYYHWVTMQHQVPFEFKNLPLP